MFVNRKRILVEFADCDPAEIVFYANYFRWFDDCTTALFAAAGIPIQKLFKSHRIVGIPIVDARARFLLPSTYGDELEAESSVTEWRKSSFVVTHKFFREGELALEGHGFGRSSIRQSRIGCKRSLFRRRSCRSSRRSKNVDPTRPHEGSPLTLAKTSVARG